MKLRRRAKLAFGISFLAVASTIPFITPPDKPAAQIVASATAAADIIIPPNSQTPDKPAAQMVTPAKAPDVADAPDPDPDTTSVTRCEGLPISVSIMVMTWSETTVICREILRVLEGVRRKDITSFEKAVYMLRHAGYAKDSAQITRDLVDIIRLRGLFNKPDRWYGTLDIIVRSWNAFNGAVGPAQVISFLRAAGPRAATALSDDGLGTAIIMIKQQYQRGG
jgi:hypothetical protein